MAKMEPVEVGQFMTWYKGFIQRKSTYDYQSPQLWAAGNVTYVILIIILTKKRISGMHGTSQRTGWVDKKILVLVIHFQSIAKLIRGKWEESKVWL